MSVVAARKKPLAVQVLQWTEDNTEEVQEWVGVGPDGKTKFMLVPPISGVITPPAVVWNKFHDWISVYSTDWIIEGVEGDYYPCDNVTFEATYEVAT
jgi:hypothetical protein